MKRICPVLLIVAAFLVVGCKKKEEESGKKTDPKSDPKKDPKDPKGVEHGKAQGKGTGGGEKTATGTKDSKPGSGKPGGGGTGDRGEYVAALGGCVLCHTPMIEGQFAPDFSKAFGGGMRMKEEFGEWVSPNITPDPETGIGGWKDEEIMAAIRDGVRPDGSKIHPIMPWPFYNTMTDDDAKALTAYLKAQAPVVNKVERNKLPEMELKLPPAKRVDPVDDPVGHGAYLASIMHCVMCHTPMTPQGPDFSKAFAGGFEFKMPEMGTGAFYASNITSDPETGIGNWTEEDIIRAVKEVKRPDGTPIMGPMQMYAQLWSQLTDEDARAIAAYVKSIPPIKNKVKKSDFQPKGGGPGGPPPTDKPADEPKKDEGGGAPADKGAPPDKSGAPPGDPDEGGE